MCAVLQKMFLRKRANCATDKYVRLANSFLLPFMAYISRLNEENKSIKLISSNGIQSPQ